MAIGVEARSPFMDHNLIEYSSTLAFRIRMKHGPKSILKNVAQKNLPDYVMNHPKIGFGMLLTPFLTETMPIWFHRELVNGHSTLSEFIDRGFMKALYSDHKRAKNRGYQMWIMYALHTWLNANAF